MKNTVFTGAGVAIVTPMHQDGSIHYEKLTELIEFQVKHHTDAIVICGTTGESSTMTDEEHIRCIRHAVQVAKGRVPVIAGAGSNDTAYAVWLSHEAEEAGADALLQVTPYYNKTSQKGLVRHFAAIAESTALPIILYNVPSRTGVSISLDAYRELCEIDNIVATKEASGDIAHIASLAAACGDKLDIYSGNDNEIVPILSLGGKGVISVLSNVMPQETHDIVSLYLEGKTKESLALQLRLLDLCKALFIDVNPIPVKEALNLMGWQAGPCRLPLAELSEAHRAKLRAELEKQGLI